MSKQSYAKLVMSGLILVLSTSLALFGCAGSAPSPTTAPSAPTKAPSAPAATQAPAAAPADTKPAAGAKPADAKPAEGAKPADAKPAAGAQPAAKPSGNPVKVGYLTPLTGRGATYGFIQQVAVKLAVDDVNASGGINGRPLEIVTFDSPFNPQEAVQGARKLIDQEKVLALVGPFTSAEAEVVAPIANQLQTPMIMPTAAKPGIAANNRPWAFAHVELDEAGVPVLIDGYKKIYPNVKRVVITGDVKESVNEFLVRNLFPRFLKEKAYEIVDTVPFETGLSDFSAVVTKIKGLNPQGLVVVGLLPEAVGVAKELERQAVKVPTMTGFQISSPPFLGISGSATEGWVSIRHSTVENQDPDFQKFLTRFNAGIKAANLQIDQVSLEPGAYDAMMMITDIARSNNITPETNLQQARTAIRDGLSKLKDWKSLYGKVTMTEKGETHWQVYAHLAKNGKWELIK